MLAAARLPELTGFFPAWVTVMISSVSRYASRGSAHIHDPSMHPRYMYIFGVVVSNSSFFFVPFLPLVGNFHSMMCPSSLSPIRASPRLRVVRRVCHQASSPSGPVAVPVCGQAGQGRTELFCYFAKISNINQAYDIYIYMKLKKV